MDLGSHRQRPELSTYERFGRRSLLISRGLINLMPRISIWWFLLRACNMAAPPSLNLLGEIGLLSSLVSWSWCRMFVLILLSFFSAAYTLYLLPVVVSETMDLGSHRQRPELSTYEKCYGLSNEGMWLLFATCSLYCKCYFY
jgi:NADH:ubiquinone oxidoreductase subunit 4 (subunit M)